MSNVPVNVEWLASLEAERDRLRAEVMRLRAEVAALRTDNERLQRDAEKQAAATPIARLTPAQRTMLRAAEPSPAPPETFGPLLEIY